jgi:hypothetical protein
MTASAVQQLLTDARVPGLSMAIIGDGQAQDYNWLIAYRKSSTNWTMWAPAQAGQTAARHVAVSPSRRACYRSRIRNGWGALGAIVGF